MASGFEMRVGDAEREAAAAELREHYASGRLTLDELNERLDAAFDAKTRGDLNTVMRDLPSARPGWSAADGRASSPAGGRPAGEPFGPGGATGPSRADRGSGPGWGPGPGGGPGPGWRPGPGWGPGGTRQGGPARALGAVIFTFVALCALLLLGTLGIFGIGVARPIAIALIIAALGLLRRLIFGRRAGACSSRRRW